MKIKKKRWLVLICALVILVLIYISFFKVDEKATQYSYGQVTRGNLDIVITCSGTLQAISTVDVGTQVSGKIAKLYVDFNSNVKKGQLLAVLDSVTLASQVQDANANYSKAKADFYQKSAIHEINKKLYVKGLISELDFVKSETDVESARASLQSAESAVERSKTNLEYAYIYSPIAGKIINRTVEQGQTVAASFSSPTLFSIAEDLSSMKILASVDESDIGQIKEGQKVKFTVQAYTDKTFAGTVTQIRLNSAAVSNVVSYTVIIEAGNEERLLLPGMTAVADFYIDHKEDVLLIPNTALRIEPGEAMMSEIQKNMEQATRSLPDSLRNRRALVSIPKSDVNLALAKNKMKQVFYYDNQGRLKMSLVVIGLTDGKNTEVVLSRELKKGMKIIVGLLDTNSAAKNSNSSLPVQQNMPPPPPMM